MEDVVSMSSVAPPSSTASSFAPADILRRTALHTKSRVPRTHAVIVVGPPG